MIRIFGHYIARNSLLLGLLEAVVLALSIYAVGVLQATAIPGQMVDQSVLNSLLLAATLMLAMMVSGVYAPAAIEGPNAIVGRLVVAAVIGLCLVAVATHGFPGFFNPLGWSGSLSAVAALAIVAVERTVIFRWPRAKALRPQIMVLGTGYRAAKIEDIIDYQPNSRRLDVVGYLPANEPRPEVPDERLLRRREGQRLWDVAQEHGITEIVVGVRDRRNGGLPVQELLECRLHGVQVTNLTDFFERETGQIPVEAVNTSWFIFTEGFRNNDLRNFNKRIFDIAASGVLLVAALPIMLVSGLAIALTMGLPIFYKQQRVGVGGEPFTIRKFRSMRNDAEAGSGAQWASESDDRITPVGHVIRLLRIDELPQIINVFDGDMSFVGPRPERPEFVRELAEQIPYYQARHSIKPGITGWAQVRYAYGASLEDAKQKLQYDLYYVKNHTLFLDLMVLVETVRVVLLGKGAR